MSTYWTKSRVDTSAIVTVSGANAATFVPGRPWDVKRLLVITTTALTVADAVVTVEVEDAGGANAVTIGTFTIPFTGSVAGDVFYVDLGLPDETGETAEDGSLRLVGEPPDLLEVNPGQQLVLTSDAGPTAGAVVFGVEYLYQGNTGERFDAAELTFTYA